MAKIVTLGEIMLRLSPQGNDRFIQSESFRIIPGGGDLIVDVIPVLSGLNMAYGLCFQTSYRQQ